MHRPLISSAEHPRSHQAAYGFTAIELMVVMAIVAILATLAAPSFTPLMERWRVRQAVEGFESTFYFARSEAIKRGGNVIVQKLPNSGDCTTAAGPGDWGCGWLVCADNNANGTCEATDDSLQQFDAPARLQVKRSGGGATIQVDRWGMVAGTWPSLTFYPQDKADTDPSTRKLCMSSGGRIRVVAGNAC